MTKNLCLGRKMITFSSCVMMGEHEVSWENMENINQITRNTVIMIQNTRFLTQKKLFLVIRRLKTLYFRAFMSPVEKIIKYTPGEHHLGSAQNGKTSSEM